MSAAHDAVVAAMVSVANIDPARVTPEAHIFDDLGIDSLDFLDVTFEIDAALGVKLPIEDWMAKAQEGGGDGQSIFVLQRFVGLVEEICAAKV